MTTIVELIQKVKKNTYIEALYNITNSYIRNENDSFYIFKREEMITNSPSLYLIVVSDMIPCIYFIIGF